MGLQWKAAGPTCPPTRNSSSFRSGPPKPPANSSSRPTSGREFFRFPACLIESRVELTVTTFETDPGAIRAPSDCLSTATDRCSLVTRYVPSAASRTIVIDGIRTHYLEYGDGPPVVLLHDGSYGSSAE